MLNLVVDSPFALLKSPPLMSGTSYRRQTFNTEDNQWESYRNMELKGHQPRRSRNDNQWVEEDVNESYSSWPRQPQQFQDPGFTERNILS